MARFYGTLRGDRPNVVSRLGHRGMHVTAASWKGAISTKLYVDEQGRECAEVTAHQWKGKGNYRVIFDGPLEELHG